jgi:predicted transcriptional regulator
MEKISSSDNSPAAAELFMQLASETRLSILASVHKKPAKLSSLSRDLNITVQDVYRNLNRLMEEGLVRRSDGVFYLTEYGIVVMKQIDGFLVMKKHREFFKEHSVAGVMPDKFLQRIGALQNCKVVNTVTAVLQKLKELESSAAKSLKLMVSQAWPEEGEIMIDKAGSGVEISVIVGHNTIFPKNVAENIAPRVEKLASKGIIKGKMIEQLDMDIYIADNARAAVMFPNAKGEVDMSTMFVGEDPIFCEWCSDYFDYLWQHSSKPVNPRKLKIVEY